MATPENWSIDQADDPLQKSYNRLIQSIFWSENGLSIPPIDNSFKK